MKYFAKNIRLLREARNLKRSDITGFSASKWGNYENDISKPGLDDLILIAKLFFVSEGDLLHIDLSKEGKFDDKGRYLKNEEKGKSDSKDLGKNSPKKYSNDRQSGFNELLLQVIASHQQTIEAQKLALSALSEQVELLKREIKIMDKQMEGIAGEIEHRKVA